MIKIYLLFILLISSAFSKYSGFIQNSGVWDSDVLYVSFNSNETIWITKEGFIYQNFEKNLLNNTDYLSDNIEINGFNLEYKFIDNSFQNVEELNSSSNQINILKGNNPDNWIQNCMSPIELVIYDTKSSAYIRYYFQNDKFRYDIYNYESFRIEVNGSDKIINKDNNLYFISNNNHIVQKDLVALVNNNEIDVDVFIDNNIITYKSKNNFYSQFTLDPLIYGTYIGGLGYDSGEDIEIDNEGNTLITGETSSLNFPATFGSYSRTLTRTDNEINPDIFVTKLDANNNHIFTTYIGSSKQDYGRSVSYDSLNQIYITGYSNFNTDFPIVGDSYSIKHNGAYDGFIIKLKNTGDIILNSTYIGGIRDDFPLSIHTFKDGRFAITGYTTQAPDSARYPATSGVFNAVYGGNIDGFVTLFNNDFSSVIWSGVIGGLKDDFPQEIKVDDKENIYICGLTRSPNYPTTANAVKRQYTDEENSSVNSDGFVSKINSNGTKILVSTLIGGRKPDIAYSLEVDNDYNIYVGGQTESLDFETTPDAYSTKINRGKESILADAFIVKLDSTAENFIFSTYIGGESNDRCYGLDIDRFGAVYGTGLTNSIDFPMSYLTFDNTFNDSLKYSDMIMFKLSKNGDSLTYSSYFGGERSDLGKSIKVKYENTVLITGNTSSTFIPTTADGIQYEYQDSLKSDAHVVEFFMEDLANSDYIICGGNSVQIKSDISSTLTTLKFQWSPVESLDDPTKEFPIASPTKSTQYQCIVTDEFNQKYVALVLVSVIPGISSQIIGEFNCDNGVEYTYYTDDHPGSKYKWIAINGIVISPDTSSVIKVVWSDSENGVLRVIEKSDFGCSDTVWKETNYRSSYQIAIVPFGDYILCEGDTVLLDAGAIYTDINWNSGSRERYDTVYKPGIHFFTAIDSKGNKYTSKQATITLKPKPSVPNVIFNSTSGEFICLSAATGYQWYMYKDLIKGATSRKFTPNKNGCYYVEITSNNGCTNKSEQICVNNLSVDENAVFNIFPNPFYETIKINSKELISKVEIYDFMGRSIMYIEPMNFETEMNLSKFSAGIYFIKVNNSEFNKIIKY